MHRRRLQVTGAAATAGLSIIGIVALCLGQTQPASAGPATDWAAFDKNVQPFFNQNCISCHGATDQEGEVRLDAVSAAKNSEKRTEALTKAFDMIRTGKMPPKIRPQPTAEQRAPALAWLDTFSKQADALIKPSPGRVTLRRLNRAEYNNTIRDLLALDVQPANAFPVDDAGYGFDNNGDVLSISPMLMEKYLAAAGLVLDKAVYSEPVVPPPVAREDAAAMEGTIPKSDPKGVTARGGNVQRAMLNGRVFNYNGEIAKEFEFPGPGQYVLRVRAYGRQRPIVQFKVDGKDVGKPVTVTEDQQNTKVYETEKVALGAGRHRLSVVFANGATKIEYEEALAKAATQPAATQAATTTAPSVRATAANTTTQPATPSVAGVPATSPASQPAAGRGAVAGAGRGRGAAGAGRGAAPVTTVTGKPTLGVIYVEAEGPLDATPDRMPESYRRVMVSYPSSGVSKAQAAEKIIRNFATKAYRRPVNEDEVKQLLGMWAKYDASGDKFEASIHTTLQAVLVSPYFLYRYEKDADAKDEGGVRTIDEYELASRLSYFLWSSMPDDELFGLAQKGQLRSNLDTQVQRMMKDPKSKALVDNFAGQWLKLRLMESVNPDAKTFPTFDDALRQAMITETQMLFLTILQENRSVLDFIDADFTFLNERLAKHYGIEGVKGEQFRRVTLSNKERGGLLTQASILTITSYPGRTSPVQRGKWVLENLFDQSPPPPPPDVPALKEQGQLTGTLRQRMEQHRANPACASCHEQMDAIGFGLENFDAIGAWRKSDGDAPIDATGSLPGGQKFSGPEQLKQIVKAHQDEFCKTLSTKLLTFALGRGLEKFDKYSVAELSSKMKADGYKFSTLVTQIVHSDPFQKRAAK